MGKVQPVLPVSLSSMTLKPGARAYIATDISIIVFMENGDMSVGSGVRVQKHVSDARRIIASIAGAGYEERIDVVHEQGEGNREEAIQFGIRQLEE